MLLVEETSPRTHTTASMASDLPHRWRRRVRADGGPSASRMVCGSSRDHIPLRDRRRGHTPLREAAFNLEAAPRFRVCVLGVDSIQTTHAERRAARQSSFTRTANATTPQVYPLLRRSSVRPRSRPHARRGGFEERRLEVKDSGRRKMNLNLTWSRRRRRRRPMSH